MINIIKKFFSKTFFLFFLLNIITINIAIGATAEELRFFDNNGNQKIDTIYIKFDKTLTGTFAGNHFGIDSDTGGLSSSDIKYSESRNDLNKNGEIILGNILKITFDEYDKIGTGLIVNPSSAGNSHLRVKTYNGVGILDLSNNEEINIGLSNLIAKSTYGTFEEIGCSGESCPSVKIEKNIIGFNGKDLKIPFFATNFKNIGGLELEFKYDNSHLTCTGIDSQILNNSGELDLNLQNSLGKISMIWDDKNEGVLGFGSGKLLDINCSVIGSEGSSSSLSLKIKELGDGNGNDLSSNVEDTKTFFIQNNITIGGKILNTDGSIFLGGNIFLKNISLNMDNIFNKISDNSGYLFDYLFKNQNYELNAVVNLNYIENTVGTGDILKIQKHIINSEKLTKAYNCKAADVNQDGKISVLDIIKIRRYLAGTMELPSGNFKFYSGIINGTINCGDLSSLSEKKVINNLEDSKTDIIFTKIRMGNVEN